MATKYERFLEKSNLLLDFQILWGGRADGGDGDDGGRISWPRPAPFPITPRDSISRSGIPLTPMFARNEQTHTIDPPRGIGVRGIFLFVYIKN